MSNERIKRIEELCNLFGPSACEDAVAEWIIAEAAELCDAYRRDRMGNLIFRRRFGEGEDPIKIMVCAHMDEVGFMITDVRDDGLLSFDAFHGSINESVIPSKRVVLKALDGSMIQGVVDSKAIHHKSREEEKVAPGLDSLYIDIGATDKETAEKYVTVGSFGSFAPNFSLGGENREKLFGKALDDRLGCAAIIELMMSLDENAPKVSERGAEVFFCFNTREEVGLFGAKTVSYAVAPDFAIVLESTTANDLYDVPAHRKVTEVGGGVALSIMDRRTIYDKETFERVSGIAEREGIKTQVKRVVAGGNDAGVIHNSRTGVKTVALSVPTRYLHSPCALASIKDFEAMSALCEATVRDVIANGK
ncbi:MAG: M42 family peptidase [Clostridia bacterium]|nr:M42 family peptidase [Clostridia bacterium]